MRDVAELAGVSVKTVSRVINDEPGVTDEVRKKVRAAVDDLGYQRDDRARSLKSGHRTRSVGLVAVDVSNPFQAELQRAVEDAVREAGYLLMSGSSDESVAREREWVGVFAERRVEGLIVVASGSSQAHLLAEIELGTPVVLVDRQPSGLDCDFVATDNVEGARMAVRQMVANGHHRIAFVGDDLRIATARLRLEGFQQELEAAGIESHPELVSTGVKGKAAAEGAMLRLLDRSSRPTAVFSSQNLITSGVVHALHRRGAQDEIALVGFDDLEFADLVRPAISVVAQDPWAMGRLAAEHLFARLDGDTSAPKHDLLRPTLIQRGSGEIHA